ncbi:MAG: GSCFA domain-containing protein [Flavobacteriales bacterium]|nr:GSCFA domain-containing protein [Flavobacteriales bacterium]
MKLITSAKIPKSDFKITYKNEVLLMGSCFSQNISKKLEETKFKVAANSFGTIYNPISIADNLNRLVSEKLYTSDDIYNYKNEKLVNFSNQNSCPNINEEKFLSLENEQLSADFFSLKQSDTIILTFGTAWVYEWQETGQIVANCHKIPNVNFTKHLLSVEEIVETYSSILNKLGDKNIVFTVSPVRHSKNGLHENNLSKSTLHLAIHELVKKFKNCSYFPAYEIVIDELRDYRFYKEDMVHPTDQAINYVWKKFSDTYFSEETNQLKEEIIKINNAASHKPFNYESIEHQQFIKKQLEVINQLKSKNPFLSFEKEIKQLNQLK